MINHNAELPLARLLIHLDGAYATNTLRAYQADMLEFIAYCAAAGEVALPAEGPIVAKFLMQTLNHGIKTATIKRKVASISAIHRLSGYADPTKTTEVRLAMRKIQRQLGTRFRQAYPVTRPVLVKLLAACGDDLRGKRNRALLLLAYDSMRRRSELVSLRVEDIDWLSDEGASILLRRSKTDQAGSGCWIHLSDEAAAAIQDWLNAAAIADGFLLRGIDASGRVTKSLCDSRIGRIYKTLARLAGLDEGIVCSISGHSMRVGGAQDLLRVGASLPQIMVKGGWAKTDTAMRYVERVHRPQVPNTKLGV
jgi:integrase